MWEMYKCKEGWVLKNWWPWIAVLEKTLENPLNSKEIKSVNPKENQSWIFIGRIGRITTCNQDWQEKYKQSQIGRWYTLMAENEEELKSPLMRVNLHYFGHWCEEPTHWKRPWGWKRLKATGEEGGRGWDVRQHHRLNGHESEQTPVLCKGQGSLACCSP